jgi:hypothetical protein
MGTIDIDIKMKRPTIGVKPFGVLKKRDLGRTFTK